jgi:mevalonate kinase
MTHAACGKVIVLGEHAVVYGKPCLAAGLDRGVEAWIDPSVEANELLSLHVEPWLLDARARDGSDIGKALDALDRASAEMFGAVNKPLALRARIHLPGAGGLGSSAALGVACIRALVQARYDRAPTIEQTLALGLEWERVFHGNPSGVDHTVAACGGAGVYTRGEPFAPVLLRAPLHLAIGDTGERTPTRTMVESVARQHARRTEAVDKTLDAIAVVVRNGALALREHDLHALGQLMDMNQSLLSSLLLSTERTELLCRVARERGAHGAKLTGGGGGGCVIALARDAAHAREIVRAWSGEQAPGFATSIEPAQETQG